MSEPSLVERAWASAQAAIGATSRVEIGAVDDLALARFGVAATGSIEGSEEAGLCDPLYLSAVLAWGAGPSESELLPDGNAADPFAGVDVSGLRLMGGGQELTFHRDARPGLPVVLDVTVSDARLKQARSGTLLVLTVERRFSDPDGVLVECRETFLGREEAS